MATDNLLDRFAEEARERILAGDAGEELLGLIAAYVDAPESGCPRWLAQVFDESLSRWETLEVLALDEAFGVQRPKGKRAKGQAAEIRLSWRVLPFMLDLVTNGSTARAARKKAATKFNISEAKAKRLYESRARLLDGSPVQLLTKSRTQ